MNLYFSYFPTDLGTYYFHQRVETLVTHYNVGNISIIDVEKVTNGRLARFETATTLTNAQLETMCSSNSAYAWYSAGDVSVNNNDYPGSPGNWQGIVWNSNHRPLTGNSNMDYGFAGDIKLRYPGSSTESQVILMFTASALPNIPSVSNYTDMIPLIIFKDNAINCTIANINQRCVFLNSSLNLGSLSGSAAFKDTACNGLNGICRGNTTFTNSASNNGELRHSSPAVGQAEFIFRDTTTNAGTITQGDGTFYTSAVNTGILTHNATFHDSTINAGTVSGNVHFKNNSTNTGTVSTAKFFNSSVNSGIVQGSVVFTTLTALSSEAVLGTVNGPIYFINETVSTVNLTVTNNPVIYTNGSVSGSHNLWVHLLTS